jgi:penicillin-binding protein 2
MGDYYLEQSVRTITKTETIEASRGIITDRNGRELVSNRQTYNLTFDSSLLSKDDDKNAAILRLIQLCREQGLTWTDNLPVTDSAPYAYTVDSMGSPYNTWFNRFLQEKMELVSKALDTADLTGSMLTEAGLSADLLIKEMREVFDIPSGWNDADARDVLGVLYELTIRELIDSTAAYVMVEDVDSPLVALVNDGNYLGAKVVSATARQYQTTYAAHILGTVGALYQTDLDNPAYEGYPLNAIIGKEGAELAFEQYLHGKNGVRVVSTNNDGKITGEYYKTEPQPGSTVELTIDLDLQQVTEDALAETIQQLNVKTPDDTRGGAAAVIRVGTGEVLALASYPTYDLSLYRQEFNTLRDDPGRPLYNRATLGTYPPGSTLKPLTAVAALESGVTTLTETVRDTGYWYYPNDPTGSGAKCWVGYPGHGSQNVTQAITNSCNFFFAEMGYRLGMNTLREYLSAFGLGQSTGIEIAEATGTLPENAAGENQSPWAAFGQANQLYSPLQLANYIATLVSGGEHRNAHLLKAVKSYDNTAVITVGDSEPTNIIEISPSTLAAVKKGMLDYTQPGGMVYSYFKDCVVTAGAKTGTAQLGSGITNNGVFVCFAPYDEPEIALAIAIEHGSAGSNLAPIAVKILNAYFTADEIGTAILGENELLP